MRRVARSAAICEPARGPVHFSRIPPPIDGLTARVLLTGATGFLGRYLMQEIKARGLTVVTAGRVGCDVELDLAEIEAFRERLESLRPAYFLNCAALSSMGACQSQPTVALKLNGRAPQALAEAADCRFLQVSTDLVFGGDEAPYHETDTPRPLSVYGMSKMEGERLGAADWVVARVPLLFGPSHDSRSGATDMLRAGLSARERLTLFANEFRTPLHAADAARGMVDLLLDREVRGIRHLGGHERVSRWEFAERFCSAHGIAIESFRSGLAEDPRRPRDVSLAGDWTPGRSLDAALRES